MAQMAEEMIAVFERTTYIVNAQAEGLSHAGIAAAAARQLF